MEPLKLIKNEEQQKPKDWKQPYISIYRKMVEDATGKKIKATWAQHKKQLENFVLKNWTDETTGEFEVPEIEAWRSELEWALKDEWFMKMRGCDIMYFMAKFGTFEKFMPNAKTKKADSQPITFFCEKCRKNVSQDHFCE